MLDVHSQPFEDLLILMCLLSWPDRLILALRNDEIDESLFVHTSTQLLPEFSHDVDIEVDLRSTSVPASSSEGQATEVVAAAACTTMLGADIHFELLRLLKYQVSSLVNRAGLQLLCQLFNCMDPSHLQQLMQISARAGMRRSGSCGMKSRSNSMGSTRKDLEFMTPPRLVSPGSGPISSSAKRKSGGGGGGGANHIQAMMMLVQDYHAIRPTISAHIFSLFVRLLSHKCFSTTEHEEFAKQLVGHCNGNLEFGAASPISVDMNSAKLVESLIMCLRVYTANINCVEQDNNMMTMTLVEKQHHKRAMFVSLIQCMIVLSQLSIKSDAATRFALLTSCSPYCIQVLCRCRIVTACGIEQNEYVDDTNLECKLVIFACEALARMMYSPRLVSETDNFNINDQSVLGHDIYKGQDLLSEGVFSGKITNMIDSIEKEVMDALGLNKIYSICNLLQYKQNLFNKSSCCKFRVPRIFFISDTTDTSDKSSGLLMSETPKFCILEKENECRSKEPAIVKFSPKCTSAATEGGGSTNDLWQQEFEKKSFTFAIDLHGSDSEVDRDDVYVYVVRECDDEAFLDWVHDSTPEMLRQYHFASCVDYQQEFVPFPCISVDMVGGTVSVNIDGDCTRTPIPFGHQISNDKAYSIHVNPSLDPQFVGSKVEICLNGMPVTPINSILFTPPESSASIVQDHNESIPLVSVFPLDEEEKEKELLDAECLDDVISEDSKVCKNSEVFAVAEADTLLERHHDVDEEFTMARNGRYADIHHQDNLGSCPTMSVFMIFCSGINSESPFKKSANFPVDNPTQGSTIFITQVDATVPDVKSLQVLPTIWQFCDEQYIKIRQQDSATQILSTLSKPCNFYDNLEYEAAEPSSCPEYAVATARGFSEGVFIYQFTVSSIHQAVIDSTAEDRNDSITGDVSFIVGLNSNDTTPLLLPLSYTTRSQCGALFSLQYNSCGSISIGTSTGYMCTHPHSTVAPPLVTGDVVLMEVIHEDRGLVRVFHNSCIVFELQDFHRYYLLPSHVSSPSNTNRKVGIGPFVYLPVIETSSNISSSNDISNDMRGDQDVPQCVIALDQFSSLLMKSFPRDTCNLQDVATHTMKNSKAGKYQPVSTPLDWNWLLSSFITLSCSQSQELLGAEYDPSPNKSGMLLYSSDLISLIRTVSRFDCRRYSVNAEVASTELQHVLEIVRRIHVSLSPPCGCGCYEVGIKDDVMSVNVKEMCTCQVDIRSTLVQIFSTAEKAWCDLQTDDSRNEGIKQGLSLTIADLIMALVGCVMNDDATSSGYRLVEPCDVLSIGVGYLLSEILIFWRDKTLTPDSDVIAGNFQRNYAICFSVFCLNDFSNKLNTILIPDMLVKSGLTAMVSSVGQASLKLGHATSIVSTICSATLLEISQRCAGCRPRPVPFSFTNGSWTRSLSCLEAACTLESRSGSDQLNFSMWKRHYFTLLRNPSTQWHRVIQVALTEIIEIKHQQADSSLLKFDYDKHDFSFLLCSFLSLCLTPTKGFLDPEGKHGRGLENINLPSVNTVCFDMRTQGVSHLWLSSEDRKDELFSDFPEGEECSPSNFSGLTSLPSLPVSNWQGALYVALVRSDLAAMRNILSNVMLREKNDDSSIQDFLCRKGTFSGYGPWISGHPLNAGEGLYLPCSVISAAKQLHAKRLVSTAFVHCLQLLSLPRLNGLELKSFEDGATLPCPSPLAAAGNVPGVSVVDRSDRAIAASITDRGRLQSRTRPGIRTSTLANGVRRPPILSSSPERRDSDPSLSSQQSLASSALAISTTTAATIAAIRSLVRDEHLRMLQLTAAVGINVDNILRSLRLQSQVIEQHQLHLMSDIDPTTDSTSGSMLESGGLDRGYLLPRDAGQPLSLLTSKKLDSPPLSRFSNIPISSLVPLPDSSGSLSISSISDTSLSTTKLLSGPSKFLYTKSDGIKAYFDGSFEACAPFGLFHGQSVRSHSFPEDFGVGVVVGVLDGHIWIHLLERGLSCGYQGIADAFRVERNGNRQENDATVRYLGGASYREDDWRFADLYVVDVLCSETKQLPNTTDDSEVPRKSSLKPNPLSGLGLSSEYAVMNSILSVSREFGCNNSRVLTDPADLTTPPLMPVVGNRVRRGKDWQWRDQDGQAGNLGTVLRVGGCCVRTQTMFCSKELSETSLSNKCWVFVEWDSAGSTGVSACSRNSYRWGVNGKMDLEIVGHVMEDRSTLIAVNEGIESYDEAYDDMVACVLRESGVPLYADFNCQISTQKSCDPDVHEYQTVSEKIRSELWRTKGFGSLISSLIRLHYSQHSHVTICDDAFPAVTTSVYHQLVGAAVLLATHGRGAVECLEFTLSDITIFLSEIERATLHLCDSYHFENGVNCAKLLSIISSNGSIFDILSNPGEINKDHEMFVLIKRIISSLVSDLTQSAQGCMNRRTLILSILRFIHDILLFAVGVYTVDSLDPDDLIVFRICIWESIFDITDGENGDFVPNLFDFAFSILKDTPSASAMTLAVDIVVALVNNNENGNEEVVGSRRDFSPPDRVFNIAMQKSVDEHLVRLANRLRELTVTPSTHIALRIVSNAMLIVVNRSRVVQPATVLNHEEETFPTPIDQLLAGVLDFAENTRDFSCVIKLMKSHPEGQSATLCKCIEILLGGKKRPKQRQTRHLKKSFSVNRAPIDSSTISSRQQVKSMSVTSWRRELGVGSRIDAKDKSHHWYEAIVKATRRRQRNKKQRNSSDGDNIHDDDVSSDSDEDDATGDWEDALGGHVEVFVHYSGWGDKYDEWIPCSSDRLQCARTETGYWREHLRLDEPIEILCLHYESPPEMVSTGTHSAVPEVKRRWFRGVVACVQPQLTGVDRILVVYDKRGCREERWINIDEREEICKVGTHVPASLLGPLGYSGDASQNHSHSHLLLKGARKKEMLESGSMETFLDLLTVHYDNLQLRPDSGNNNTIESLNIMQHAFEALLFLLPSSSRLCTTGGGGDGNCNSNIGGDNMMSNSSRLCALATLEPAGIICKCLRLTSGYIQGTGDSSAVKILAEDILETACDILASLASSHDAQVFSVGDAVEAQWRRRGNVSFPGRIARIRDYGNVSNNITSISSSVLTSNITFDIHYDDGDREERIPMDRVTHLSSVAYYNSLQFLSSLMACEGPSILWKVLTELGNELPEDITISILSVLSTVIESMHLREVAEMYWTGIDWNSPEVSWLDDIAEGKDSLTTVTPRPYAKVLLNMLSDAVSVKSSSRLVMQILNFYRILAETSVLNKNRLYAIGVHAISIQCLSAFPHHPKVLCQALNLLAAIASKDGTIETPICTSSSGPVSFNSTPSLSRRHFWQSEDRVPSAVSPHWIDISLPTGRQWREVQVQLGDYGSASPELIVVKYSKQDISIDGGPQFVEVRRANISGAEGWVTLVNRREVSEFVVRFKYYYIIFECAYLIKYLQCAFAG